MIYYGKSMKIDDVIFKEVTDGRSVDPSQYCHFGWEGTGAYAFARYADAYYESACSLYEKIQQSRGQYSVIDSLGITMCFCYRHFVELYLKFIYVKYACKTEEEYKDFLKIGHNLVELWNAAKPTLKAMKDRVGTTVNLNIVEHYIKEINHFDDQSMSMRYPINKELKQMHPNTRLDLLNLHDRMHELHYALEGLVYDYANQITISYPIKEMEDFKDAYRTMAHKVSAFLDQVNTFVDRTPRITHLSDVKALLTPSPDEVPMTVYEAYSDDEIMLFDILFYTGRDIKQHEVTLPLDKTERLNDVVKLCLYYMKNSRFVFGQPKNMEVNIYGKCASAQYDNIIEAKKILDELVEPKRADLMN